MDTANPLSPAKRPFSHDGEIPESNGKRKRHHSGLRRRPPFSRPDLTIFRILCPGSKTGSIIGKGGSIIKSIRHDTGALIKVEDAVPGVEERVVTISAKEVRSVAEKREAEDALEKEVEGKDELFHDSDEGEEDADGAEEGANTIKTDTDGEATALKTNTDGELKKADISPAQEALLRVHMRIVENEPFQGEEIEKQEPPTKIATRLLVPTMQVGCLLGKRGKIIEKMRQETGAQIRVLPKELLPGCALPSDEVVQITGDLPAVRKALHAVSSQLQHNPPKDRNQGLGTSFPIGSAMSQPLDPFLTNANMFSQGNSLGHQMDFRPSFSPPRPGIVGGPQHSLAHPTGLFLPDHGLGLVEPLPPVELDVRFRLLCPRDRIGSIIGKGGSIVRTLREETGAKIHIEDAASDADERVVLISAIELANDNISKAQEAALRVQSRITDFGPDKDGVVTTKLLVPADQVGCLIGKGGTIIAEMRRATHANIRIYGKEQLPFRASETDELVQVIGDLRISQDALMQITTRLRNNLIREKLGLGIGENKFAPLPGAIMQGGGPVGNPIGPGGGPISAFGRRPEPVSPGRLFPSLPDLGLRGNGPRHPSPGNWPRQGIAGGGGHLGLQPHHERGGDLMRPGATPIITNTTVEVVVPEHVMGSIIGPFGNNLAEIRRISGANVHVYDLLPGATERTVEISGTPDQTHAAQSLLQAFIFSGQ